MSRLLPLAATDGVLHKMSEEGIAHDKIVNIVVDLILAAADTVRLTFSYYKTKSLIVSMKILFSNHLHY